MYDTLLEEAHEKGLTVIEKYPFLSPRIRGLCCDGTIALSDQIDTAAERTVILCEEIAHADHSAGNILHDPRAERRARQHSFDRLIGTEGLLRAWLAGCREYWEFAEFFGVTESFLRDVVANYAQRFGTSTRVKHKSGNYTLSFLPTFTVRQEKDSGKA